MRSNIEGSYISGSLFGENNKFLRTLRALTGSATLVSTDPHLQFLNPNGSDRIITLPAASKGAWFCIFHTGTANTLTVNNAAAVGVTVIGANGSDFVFCDGTNWFNFKGASLGSITSGTSAPTSYSTAGAQTYTAADLLSGTIVRDPNGAARSDVTPTAALLVAAIPGATIGDTVSTWIVNGADAAEVLTITAGAGATFDANQTATSRVLGQNTSKLMKCRLTNVTPAAEAYVIYV